MPFANFDPVGRPPSEKQSPAQPRYYAKDISPSIGLGNGDSSAIQDAIDTVDGLGGGELIFDRRCILDGDVDCPRNVIPMGTGALRAILASDGTQRKFNILGPPALAPNFLGDQYIVSGLTFDKVTLKFGVTSPDKARGCKAMHCQFLNSDVGLYVEGLFQGAFSGVGAAYCKFRLCEYGIWFNRAGPAHFVNNCIIDECTQASIMVNGVMPDGVSLFISECYADHTRRFLKTVGPAVDGGIYINDVGVELCGSASNDTDLGDGYWIENDGCNIFIDGINGAKGVHTDALFWNKSGNMFIKRGRQAWGNNEYVRIDSGNVVVDQSEMFSAGKLWGEGQIPFATANSTGGVVVAPRTGFMGTMHTNPPALTNAVRQQAIRAAEGYDGNDRIYEFDLEVTSLAATNALRLFMGDGVHNVFIDLVFPAIVGGGRVRAVWNRNQTWSATITYSPRTGGVIPPAAASPPTKGEYDILASRVNIAQAVFLKSSVVDNTTLGNTKTLTFESLALLGVASGMTISNVIETIAGPHVVGI